MNKSGVKIAINHRAPKFSIIQHTNSIFSLISSQFIIAWETSGSYWWFIYKVQSIIIKLESANLFWSDVNVIVSFGLFLISLSYTLHQRERFC